jgi:hypothetical protein
MGVIHEWCTKTCNATARWCLKFPPLPSIHTSGAQHQVLTRMKNSRGASLTLVCHSKWDSSGAHLSGAPLLYSSDAPVTLCVTASNIGATCFSSSDDSAYSLISYMVLGHNILDCTGFEENCGLGLWSLPWSQFVSHKGRTSGEMTRFFCEKRYNEEKYSLWRWWRGRLIWVCHYRPYMQPYRGWGRLSLRYLTTSQSFIRMSFVTSLTSSNLVKHNMVYFSKLVINHIYFLFLCPSFVTVILLEFFSSTKTC